MAIWTNKQWGAVIAALVAFSVALLGFGETAVIVIVGVIGYFVGMFLDGELNLQDIRQRVQGQANSRRPPQ